MSKWQEALKAKNYTPENLGAAGKNGIKEYQELEQVLNGLKELKDVEGYDEKELVKLEKELEHLDNKICRAIELIDKRREIVKKAQDAKKAKVEERKNASANVVVEQPKVEQQQVEIPKEVVEETPINEEQPKEKKGKGIGWFLGITATVALGFLGVRWVKNNT